MEARGAEAGEQAPDRGDVVNGELPRDMKLLGGMVSDISFGNAHRFFGLDVPMA